MEHLESISKFKESDGIWHSLTDMSSFSAFEEDYVYARKQEQRVFSIGEIRKLPEVRTDYIHAEEWQIRKRSIHRFQRYMENRAPLDAILDIGCGNGFFTNILSRYAKRVVGIDINLTELRQASKAFEENRILEWYYADVFGENIVEESFFDMITFCCSFQYFPDIEKTMERCFRLLKPGGSIHILESPFYEAGREQEQARERTIQYYRKMGMEYFSKYYFHHSWHTIMVYKPVVHYRKPHGLQRVFSAVDSPFPWLEIPNNSLINALGIR